MLVGSNAVFWAANDAIVAHIRSSNIIMKNVKYVGLGETVELSDTEVAFVVDLTDFQAMAGEENSRGATRKVDLVATSGGFAQIPAGIGYGVNINVTRDPNAKAERPASGGSRKGPKKPSKKELGL